MINEASFYEKLENNDVQCSLCPHQCKISEKMYGLCRARKNVKGTLFSMVYNRPVSVNIDPIEKKPFYHFLPGSRTFSIGTIGCNLKCQHCQNWQTSQGTFEDFAEKEVSADEIITDIKKSSCNIISYTYNEPTVFYEYMRDIAIRAKEEGIRNTIVSNGYINKNPLKKIIPYIDAVNIDLKSFRDGFYKDICKASLKPVLETLKTLHKNKVWIEITNLIIPDENDKLKEIKKMCDWIVAELGTDYPIHFSAFYPQYKMHDKEPTSAETLQKAKEVAEKSGLNFVYLGNVITKDENNTRCPSCKKLLIERFGHSTIAQDFENGFCSCKHKISGIWK